MSDVALKPCAAFTLKPFGRIEYQYGKVKANPAVLSWLVENLPGRYSISAFPAVFKVMDVIGIQEITREYRVEQPLIIIPDDSDAVFFKMAWSDEIWTTRTIPTLP